MIPSDYDDSPGVARVLRRMVRSGCASRCPHDAAVFIGICTVGLHIMSNFRLYEIRRDSDNIRLEPGQSIRVMMSICIVKLTNRSLSGSIDDCGLGRGSSPRGRSRLDSRVLRKRHDWTKAVQWQDRGATSGNAALCCARDESAIAKASTP
jgi:hypothetical protein